MAGSIPPPDFFPRDGSRSRASFGPEGIEERYKSGAIDHEPTTSSSSSYTYQPPVVLPPRPKCGVALPEPVSASARRGWPLPSLDPRQHAIACVSPVATAEATQRSLTIARDELVGPLGEVVSEMAREAAVLQYPAYPLQTRINLGLAYLRARERISDASQHALERDGLDRHGTSMLPTFEFLFSAEYSPRLQARIAAGLPADLSLVTYNVDGLPVSSVFVDIRGR